MRRPATWCQVLCLVAALVMVTRGVKGVEVGGRGYDGGIDVDAMARMSGTNVGIRIELPHNPSNTQVAWHMYFDAKTNRPYYHNSVSGVTQWEHPYPMMARDTNHLEEQQLALRSATSGGVQRLTSVTVGAIRVYNRFAFRGILDHLPVMADRSAFVNHGARGGVVDSIEQLAEVSLDIIQSQLERGIAYLEAKCDRGECDDLTDETVVEVYETLSSAWNNLGLVWFSRGDWEVYLECLRRSLWWNPMNTSTLANLMNALRELGRDAEVQQVQAFSEDPNAYLARLQPHQRPKDPLPVEALAHGSVSWTKAGSGQAQHEGEVNHSGFQHQPHHPSRSPAAGAASPSLASTRPSVRHHQHGDASDGGGAVLEWVLWHPATQLCFVAACVLLVRAYLLPSASAPMAPPLSPTSRQHVRKRGGGRTPSPGQSRSRRNKRR